MLMGWTSYHINDTSAKGRISAVESCIDTAYEVVRSAMVGSVYCGALKEKTTGAVLALVVPTKVSQDYFNFAYKMVPEDYAPVFHRYPVKLLDLLSPAKTAEAEGWRRKCREIASRPPLSRLPIGARIRTASGQELVKCSPAYQFRTPWYMVVGSNTYLPKKDIGEDWELVSEA